MYNVESYIEKCIESALEIKNISTEIIIIDDGSTDSSYQIAKTYADSHSNIFLYHQKNRRQAETRNRALKIAKGLYILFLDSDDWLENEASQELFRIAIENNYDMVMGRIKYKYQDMDIDSPFKYVPPLFLNKEMTGENTFIQMMKDHFFIPMACSYLFNRNFLVESQIKFIDLTYEDEIWTIETLVRAKKVMLTNIEFYCYRQRDNSITTGISSRNRIINLLKVAAYLFKYSQLYSFYEKRELKSWIIVKILWLYTLAYQLLITIKDSSFIFPKDHVSPLSLYRSEMSIDSLLKYDEYLNTILKYKGENELYCKSRFFNTKINKNKTIVLLYNYLWNDLASESLLSKLPENYILTTDRKYFNTSKAVVFHLPDLLENMEDDLIKQENQLWVAWNMECEENYPWMKDDAIYSMFDLRMDYHQDADVVYPYYTNFKEYLNREKVSEKENKVCMIISSSINQSGRMEYIKELIEYIDIDSYGKLYNNMTMVNDIGRETKLQVYSKYKFVIAFENAICQDYVTEKFYDPLIVGSVPIYMGAPNIEELIPGDNCYINVRDYKSAKDLADYLKRCFQDNDEYMKYHKWRRKPLRKGFVEKVEVQDIDPFVRLCNLLNKRL
jgi:glycosyltransferase involved in cell wall biosynthesis